MNVSSIRLLCLSFAIIPFCGASHTSSPLEFKQAIARYIKHTDVHYLQHAQRHADENEPYKKELRYLFKNYGNMSPSALLSRVRSAHQEMVKHESDMNSDVYKRYEQISSALLLICAQSFFYDVRTQILNALDEIDHLIMYWRYQQHHQIDYFFHKFPAKWVMGKSQAKEIVYNLALLEHKQRELYTLLGVLAGHAHTLTTCDVTYEDCYQWMNALLTVLSQGYELLYSGSDGTQFDTIAAQLALRIKKVDSFEHDLLRSLSSVRKPNHFVRNWIAYTAMLTATGCAIHYDYNNDGAVQKALSNAAKVTQDFCTEVVVDRIKSFWKAIIGKDSKKSTEEIKKKIDDRVTRLRDLGLTIKSDFNKELAKGADSLLSIELNSLYNFFKDTKEAKYAIEGKYIFNDELESLYSLLEEAKKIDFKFDDETKMLEIANFDITQIDTLTDQMSYARNPLLKLEGGRIKRVLVGIRNILYPAKVYTVIADESIAPAIQEGVDLFADIGEIVGEVAEENLWTSKFTALIPLISMCFVVTKTYQWATARDYSPIRIALADVNALLIESAAKFDDYAYGKLLYLIFKLRHRASALKDTLAHEFLGDVAKLELKQYDSATKHSIIENMFNKYAFLGRVNA